MDLLDTHEKDSISKKCNRVRSWYLYEQYKSLERNQIDAACLLKSKSYQNNLLRQELKERRARRRLCDSNELCRSEFRTNKDNILRNDSVSDDNLFDSVCELHEDVELKDICSCDGSKTSKYDENINKEDLSCSDSVLSVVDNVTSNYPQDVKKELEIVKKNIAQNINLQLETVKENVECLEKFTKLNDEDLLSRGNSEVADIKDVNKNVKEKSKNSIESLLSIWSKLVLFAYNTSQLNHGNCYCHFSFQLVTAVLACDFLRRSVDKMCNYFQSYVSPIKFASSDCNTLHLTTPTKALNCYEHKKNKRKPLKTPKNCKYCYDGPWLKRNYNKKYNSEYKSHSKYAFSNTINERKCRGASEPWQSFDIHETKIGGSCRLNTDSDKRFCYCHDLEIIVDRIQQVARDMEILLEDVDDTSSKYYF
ncbi:uncharacterized protein LOC116776876 isoform X1 [Danaus plexippus]|uniref:uncharacterized protein LOC116776876 isoform X1 n=1 Tax=Danaus plexippus TaxID=13037 RepID=UPI002AB1D95C|nr:uncharacterized protein LOC116776876 isoform X1 [Danaus plexippus]